MCQLQQQIQNTYIFIFREGGQTPAKLPEAVKNVCIVYMLLGKKIK